MLRGHPSQGRDEARFCCINDVRRCWAPKPIRPLCRAMLTHEYSYAYAAVDIDTGELDSLSILSAYKCSWTKWQRVIRWTKS